MAAITLKQWANHFRRAAARATPELELAVAANAKLGAEIARGYIGHAQPPVAISTPVPVYFPAWPELAASTIEDKDGLGFGPPDYDPLYRTGQMQESISGTAIGLAGCVGSTDQVAVYHEFGTAKMPPRPFLARAVASTMPAFSMALGRVGVSLLKPKA